MMFCLAFPKRVRARRDSRVGEPTRGDSRPELTKTRCQWVRPHGRPDGLRWLEDVIGKISPTQTRCWACPMIEGNGQWPVSSTVTLIRPSKVYRWRERGGGQIGRERERKAKINVNCGDDGRQLDMRQSGWLSRRLTGEATVFAEVSSTGLCKP